MKNLYIHYYWKHLGSFTLIFGWITCVWAYQCQPFRCVGYGNACNSYTACLGNNTYCNSAGRCAFSFCEPECGPGLWCNGTSCIPIKISGPGEICANDFECQFNNVSEIIQMCIAGVCMYIPDGSECSPLYAPQCRENSFCSHEDSLCHPKKIIGEQCELQLNSTDCVGICVPDSLQITESGTCVERHSVDAGLPCTKEACAYGSFCAAPSHGNTHGHCVSLARTPTLYQPCEDDWDCDAQNSEYCDCVTMFPTSVCVTQVLPSNYSRLKQEFQDCVDRNGCGTSLSCQERFCTIQYCNLFEVEALRTPSNDTTQCDTYMLNFRCTRPVSSTLTSSTSSSPSTFFSSSSSSSSFFPNSSDSYDYSSENRGRISTSTFIIGLAVSPAVFVVVLALLICGPCLLFRRVRRNLRLQGASIFVIIHEKSRAFGVAFGRLIGMDKEAVK